MLHSIRYDKVKHSYSLNVKCSVVSLVNRLCNVCRTDTVTDFTYKWSRATESIHISSVRTLTYCTDYCIAWDQHLISFRVLADKTFRCHS